MSRHLVIFPDNVKISWQIHKKFLYKTGRSPALLSSSNNPYYTEVKNLWAAEGLRKIVLMWHQTGSTQPDHKTLFYADFTWHGPRQLCNLVYVYFHKSLTSLCSFKPFFFWLHWPLSAHFDAVCKGVFGQPCCPGRTGWTDQIWNEAENQSGRLIESDTSFFIWILRFVFFLWTIIPRRNHVG